MNQASGFEPKKTGEFNLQDFLTMLYPNGVPTGTTPPQANTVLPAKPVRNDGTGKPVLQTGIAPEFGLYDYTPPAATTGEISALQSIFGDAVTGVWDSETAQYAKDFFMLDHVPTEAEAVALMRGLLSNLPKE